MNTITVTLMTYGADLGQMLGGLATLATLCLMLRRPRGKHRKSAGRRVRPKGGRAPRQAEASRTGGSIRRTSASARASAVIRIRIVVAGVYRIRVRCIPRILVR